MSILLRMDNYRQFHMVSIQFKCIYIFRQGVLKVVRFLRTWGTCIWTFPKKVEFLWRGCQEWMRCRWVRVRLLTLLPLLSSTLDISGSIVTHYTSGTGITFIAIVQRCVLCVGCIVLMLFCLSISESKHWEKFEKGLFLRSLDRSRKRVSFWERLKGVPEF